MVDGKLYAASPNNVFAVDARDGAVLWHNYWKIARRHDHRHARSGHAGQPHLLHAARRLGASRWTRRNGKEVWRHEVAPFDQQYFSSIAPMPIKGHLLVGTGNDLDAPAFLKSLDPTHRRGASGFCTRRRRRKAIPASKRGPASTRRSTATAPPGFPASTIPETNLYMYGTGNPTPPYTQGRGEGDNLFTSSLLAVDVDTGKMKWYFQTSPHDTHDWDSTQTPVIVDAPFNGRMRKLVMTATRNGYFFVLDRATGEHLVTSKIGLTNVWAQGLDDKGQPKRNPYKDAHDRRARSSTAAC